MSETRESVEIVGPFKGESKLVINGWEVPCVTAYEADGGEIWVLLDGRIGLVVPAAQFEEVATFVADVIGHCWGYGAHPRGDVEDRQGLFRAVPHPSLAPRRMHEITAADGPSDA